ncbi:ExeA family protein [Loktanella agnita]|uniref:ExeA family protein n=1 Tax=Loktanella agnita TaxID=287097 RepID=UPI003987FB52
MKNFGNVASVFGFDDRPFKLLPDPNVIFWSPRHEHAFETLRYGLTSCAPITLLTGEIGAGKTTLLRKLMEETAEDLIIGLVSNVMGTTDQLLHWILNALDVRIESGASYVTLFQTLQDLLIEHYAAGRRVVLIFDEAQNIRSSGLEELRMLTNINSGVDELLQLILIGQPELRDTINLPELRQVKQRVAANYHLTSMGPEETTTYIRHLLRAAGGTGNEIADDAISDIFTATQGTPRLINQLCNFAMVRAATTAENPVSRKTVTDVLGDGMFLPYRLFQQEKTS